MCEFSPSLNLFYYHHFYSLTQKASHIDTIMLTWCYFYFTFDIYPQITEISIHVIHEIIRYTNICKRNLVDIGQNIWRHSNEENLSGWYSVFFSTSHYLYFGWSTSSTKINVFSTSVQRCMPAGHSIIKWIIHLLCMWF